MATKRKADIESEAALKAVEDALNFDLSGNTADASDSTFSELERSLEAAARELANSDAEIEQPVQAGTGAINTNVAETTYDEIGSPDLAAANDDRADAVSGLVYSLQKKASMAPLWVAGLFSVIWLALFTYYVRSIEPSFFNGDLSWAQILRIPRTFVYLVVAVLPVFLFFGLAVLFRRAQEMKNAAQSMTEAAVRLMQPEEIATDSLSTVGRAIRREVSSINNSFEQTLARAGDLEVMVQKEVLNLERSYADSEIKLSNLVSDLGTERDMVVDHASRLRHAISTSHVSLSQEMNNLESRLTGHINESGAAIVNQVEAAGQNATRSLSDISGEIQSSLSDSTTQFQSLFSQQAVSLTDQIQVAGNNVASMLEMQTVSLKDQGDAITRQLEDAVGIQIADFTSRLAESGDTLQTMLDNRLNALDGTLSIKGDAFVEALGTRTEALDKVLSDRTDVISNTLAERLSVFGQSMTGHVDSVVTELQSRHAALEKTTSQVEETVNVRSAQLVEALTVKNDELSKTYLAGEANIKEAMISGLQELIGKAEDIRVQIDGQSSQLIDNMDDKSKNLVADIDDRIRQLAGSVEDNANILRDLLDEKTSIIFSGINARTTDMLTGIDETSRGFAQGLEDRVSGINETIKQTGSKFLDGVEAGKLEFEQVADQKAHELTGVMQAGQEHIANAVESKYGLFSKLLDEKRDMISTDLDNRIASTATVLDKKAVAIADILNKRAEVINSTLSENVTENQRLLETKANEFNNLLSTRSTELEKIINQKALPLVDAIKEQGDIVSVKMGAVHETISEDVTSLLGKLGTASEALASLVVKSADDLNKIDTNITTQAEKMSGSIIAASEHIDKSVEKSQLTASKLDSSTQELFANIGGIAERFDSHGKILLRATEILDSAQNQFSSSLEERGGAIDSLARGLAEKSSEIELSMAAFSQLLSKTLDDATQRTRMVNSTLSDEIKASMEETNARFAAASEAMRIAASDVQRDLEDTRAEMRKGVMDLPEETRQSTDAMRKVVADQIAALRDLSEIVTRSGKAMDASPGVAASYTASSVAPAAAAPSFPPRTSAPPRPAPAPVTRAPQPAPSVRTTTASGQANTGWVSDLLRRASVDETPAAQAPAPDGRSPLHMVESLNSLSMDIARQIDHEASIELWDRYQRGERNVFTRRLYTIQGQQTFDEIKSKYAREPEFRTAVDRYIADFEKLLEEVARNDRDNMMVQTYLTSDTGKVYTMLAHASGRLGNQ